MDDEGEGKGLGKEKEEVKENRSEKLVTIGTQ